MKTPKHTRGPYNPPPTVAKIEDALHLVLTMIGNPSAPSPPAAGGRAAADVLA